MDKEILGQVQEIVLVTAGRLTMKVPPFVKYTCSGACTLAALSLAAPTARALRAAEDAQVNVRTPEDVVRWLARDFDYTMMLGGGVRSADEMLAARTGDCDDFAILASDMLERLGVENQVLILRFHGLSMAHAICIWKDKNGLYSFISNKELCRTGKDTVEAAVRKFYPDCETIASIDPCEYVRRSKASRGTASKSFRGAELMADLDPRMTTGL
jgi:hypothetical protein